MKRDRLVRSTELALVALLVLGCGPKQPPEAAPGGGTDLAPPVGEAPGVADPETQALAEKLAALIGEVNAAIDSQDADKFFAAFTDESRDLFFKVAEMDMAIAGIKGETPAQHILKQQKDFNVVYTVENPDPASKTATLVGVMRATGDEVRFPFSFVEKDGGIVVDYTQVLAGRLENLTASRMTLMIAELNKALDAADEALFASVVSKATSEKCPDFFHVLPPSKAKKPLATKDVLAKLQKAGLVVEISGGDPVALTATLASVVEGKPGSTLQVSFVVEEGAMKIDASSACAAASD